MKFNLSPSPLHAAASCFRDPLTASTENINSEAGPSTALLPTASPAARMLGMLSPAWVQKAVKEYSLSKKYPLQWDPERLLVDPERGNALLQNLKLHKKNVARGQFGSISIFKNQNGEKLVGKFFDPTPEQKKHITEQEFFQELVGLKAIYEAETVGRHRNLVNMYGTAKMLGKTGEPECSILLMDVVPGPTGMKLFDTLRNSLKDGKISSTEYWGAIQFIGKRLFDVVEHMSKAEVVHNDINPDNFLVNEETGEPVLIDLGNWGWKDDSAPGFSEGYASPEARVGYPVDEKSDVFCVCASLLHGIEGGEIKSLEDMPNRGLRLEKELHKDDDGNIVRQSRTYAVKTAYIDFMNRGLANDRSIRLAAKQAKNHPFLHNALLDDDAAKQVIKDVISQAKEEEKLAKGKGKPPKSKPNAHNSYQFKQVKREIESTPAKSSFLSAKLYGAVGISESQVLMQSCLKLVKKSPNLHAYARLQSLGKNDPELKKYLEKNKNTLAKLEPEIGNTMVADATAYIEQAKWFAHAKSVLEKVPTAPVKSGVNENGVDKNWAEKSWVDKVWVDKVWVDEHGVVHNDFDQNGVDKNVVRRHTEYNDIDLKYADAVNEAKKALPSYADTETLKHYVNDAEKFLYEASTLKKIDNQEEKEKIEQVRERATLTRRMLEILEMDSSLLSKATLNRSFSLPHSAVGTSKNRVLVQRSAKDKATLNQSVFLRANPHLNNDTVKKSIEKRVARKAVEKAVLMSPARMEKKTEEKPQERLKTMYNPFNNFKRDPRKLE